MHRKIRLSGVTKNFCTVDMSETACPVESTVEIEVVP